MDYDSFNLQPPEPEPVYKDGKDPYKEPPVKDFSHLLSGRPKRNKPKNKFKKFFFYGLALLLLGIIIFMGINTLNKSKAPHPHKVVKKVAVVQKPQPLKLSQYISSGFNLTFNYPHNWSIADGGSASLVITSTPMTLISDRGKSLPGRILISVKPQGQLPVAFGPGNAVAVLPSQVITYTTPGTVQTGSTYISFVQYSSATVKGTLNGIYITGNYGYQQDQIIPRANIVSMSPLVTVTFEQCMNASCTSLHSLNITSSEWNNPQFNQPILAVLKSLSFN